jgi:hypothetical protein
MMGQFDAGKLKLFPVKLGTEKLKSPSWLRDVQYLRYSEYPSPDALVDKIISTYDGG